ncbi:ABC transporter permease [Piscinibacter koreensis]|uniref:FtsX-like permease family protein n=1 Tax=Piscinibacter koreensis TaxID=2742824 RepID=A0A7Y6NPF5_9BURK|nr:FtsX-like permease family protein [Schlegelella koreensis]NUZ06879.1 FtsX-like permease family protein [Schlegelella koreensis]
MTEASRPPAPLVPSAWRLGWRQLMRDFRAGELRLLVVAVMLAVAALSAVGFFADRINGGLARDARQLLGGDAIVASDQPAPPAFAERARALGLAVATTASFPSMGRAPDEKGGATRLVSVKAVSDAYPLRGELRLNSGPDTPETGARRAPVRGKAWVDPALLDALGLKVGDPLLLGDASLAIEKVIAIEPDRGTGFSSFAPRVLINEADLPATGLIQPASRVGYRLAVAAPDPNRDRAVRQFVDWAEAHVKGNQLRGVRVESLETGRPEMRQTLDRAEKFLNLVALLAALLAAVAVGIASRDFATRHLDDCAMLRVLGLPQRTIALQYLTEFGLIGVLASVAGLVVGFAVHHVFVLLLAGLVKASLPPPSLWPALFGVGVGFTLLLGFGLPPVLQLARVPPLRVIRRDVGAMKPASLAVLAAGALGFAALLLGVSSDLKLGAIAVGGFAAAVAVFALLSWLALALLRRAVPEARAPRWLVLATRQLAARPAFAVLQVSALAVGLLALVLLALLRTDLIGSWRSATPKDAPNRFVINVQPAQADAFQQRLREAGVTRYDWYPMIRGRLVAINGRAVDPDAYADTRAQRLLDREFNLSHSPALPGHNTVEGGRWVPDEPNALSVESGLAETLGLKLGDRLRFDMAGETAEGRITSLRKVDWSSMRVNFFVLFPTTEMADAPVTYIAAYQAPKVAGFDNALARDFPNITSIDVSATIAQVQGVIDQVVRAVEFLFGFTLAAGLVVLFAAITATREARAREFAVMRALGASARLLAQVQRGELLGVGALAGVLASLAAIAVSWALARWVFEFSWNPAPWVPIAGGAAGALLALSAGWWGLREVLRRPVVQTLRQAAD